MNKSPQPRSGKDAWSENQISILKALFPTESNTVVAEKTTRSIGAVRAKAQLLGLKKEKWLWQKKDEQFILKNWALMTAVEIGDKIGKSRWSAINKYRELQKKV